MSTHATPIGPSWQPKKCEGCGAEFFVKPSHFQRRKFCSKTCAGKNLVGSKNPHWKGGFVILTCNECGGEYQRIVATSRSSRFCSRYCLAKNQSRTRSGNNNPLWKGGHKEAKRRFCEKERLTREVIRQLAKETIEQICKSKFSRYKESKRQIHKREIFDTVIIFCMPAQIRPRRGKIRYFKCLDCGVVRARYDHPKGNPTRCKRCDHRNRRGSNNSNWKGGITPEHRRLRNSEQYRNWRKLVFERDKYTCQKCGQIGWTLHAHHIKEWSEYPALRFELSNGITLCESCHKKTDNWLVRARWRKRRVAMFLFKEMNEHE